MYQQNQIPVDQPVRADSFFNINGNLPPLLNIDFGNPDYNRMYPEVAVMLINEIQQQKRVSPARMYVFNLYSTNGYANDLFFELLKATMDWITMNDYLGGGQIHLRHLVNETVPMMVSLMTGYQISINFELFQQCMPYEALQGANRAIMELQQISAKIQAWKTGNLQPAQQPYGMQNQMQQRGGFPNTPAYAQRGGNFQTNQYGHAARSTPSNFGGGPVNNGAVDRFSNESDAVLRQQVQPRGASSYFADTPAQQPSAPVPQSTMEKPEILKIVEPINETKQLKFTPTEQQIYLLAFNNRTHQSFLEKDENGKVRQTFKEIVVNQADHRVPGFAPAGIPSTTARANQVVDTLMDALQVPEPASDQELPVPVKAIWQPTLQASLSMDECLLNTRIRREAYRVKNGAMPEIFTSITMHLRYAIGQDGTGKEDESILAELAKSTTYIGLLNNYLGVRHKLATDTRQTVEKIFTDLINDIFEREISSPVRIQSFVDDLQECLEYLRKRYGEVAFTGVMRDQEHYIQALLDRPGDEVNQMILEDFLTDGTGQQLFEEGQQPAIVPFQELATITMVNADASELCVDFQKGQTSMLTEGRTPFLYDLAKQLFESVSKDPLKYRAHYLVTNDNIILRLTTGKLSTSETYLISLA